MAGRMQDLRRPPQLVGAEFGEVALDGRATVLGLEIAVRDFAALARQAERMA
jgi:hypothetical protein